MNEGVAAFVNGTYNGGVFFFNPLRWRLVQKMRWHGRGSGECRGPPITVIELIFRTTQ